MISRALPVAALAALSLGLAACERKAPEVAPTEAAPAFPASAPPPEIAPAPVHSAPSAPATPRDSEPSLDAGALNERRDPDRLLRYYAAALAARDWAAAAKAWGPDSGVTAATLKAAYDRPEAPRLELGKGEVEGAAGSLYYEAPVSQRFGGATPERGNLILRRANDVPGASAEQERWRIERSTIGAAQ
jgi:hypothetical protein